ncbi:ROK family protein [Millisia brevis]|uniref:ROK family protein n=1 Tax=Millisia brevis TaxID=264148 RepID=UPI00082B41E2|nr:ROK family protein [Millisia brevis]
MARPESDRPTTDIPTDATTRLSIGVDIGGSNIRGALVDSVGAVHTVIAEATPDTVKELDDTLTVVIERLVADQPAGTVVGVGLAVAGFLDRDRRIVRFAPHLPWVDRPVGEILADRWGLPVLLEHDANSAGWAEYRHGAAAGARVGVVVTIGTGIGAALLVDGELFRGAHGVAPELGHLQVVPGGRRCPCGKRGCLERYCSGTALVDTATELALEGDYAGPLAQTLRAARGGVVGRDVVSAADAGDPLGVDTMHRFGDWLAVGLASVVDVFDPDCIVLCGGMARRSIRELGDVQARLRPLATGGAHRPLPDVRLGMLGETAGLIGAADLAAARFGGPSVTAAG